MGDRQWEYKVHKETNVPRMIPDEMRCDLINRYGREGWELVTITVDRVISDQQLYMFWFKRELKSR